MPDACIAADIMAGFNGEDEDEFLQVCRFVESLPLSYLHVFTYSDRPHTAALRMAEKIDMAQRRKHSHALQEISNRKRETFCLSQVGKQHTVLWESTRHSDGTMQGWTDNYVRLCKPYDPAQVGVVTTETVEATSIVYNFPTEG